ncbi:MAG: ArsR/SmtB family transcription factor [Promethearchaeota archaeon]
MSDENPGISKILKAINSTSRRDILRTLNFLKRPMSFTEVMNEVVEESTSSSQFSYHLNVLTDAGLIAKAKDGKYHLTTLGNRTGLLLEMSQEDEKSAVFSSLYLAFSNMTPRDCLLAILIVPMLAMMISSIFNTFNPLLFVISCFPLATILYYLYKRLNSLIAMIFLINFFWVIFVPGTVYLIPLYLLVVLFVISLIDPGAFTLYVGGSQFFSFPLNILISIVLGMVSIIVASAYYLRYTKKMIL